MLGSFILPKSVEVYFKKTEGSEENRFVETTKYLFADHFALSSLPIEFKFFEAAALCPGVLSYLSLLAL